MRRISFSKLATCGSRLALPLILGLALAGSVPVPVQAQEAIDLMVGGEGATSWDIVNIQPGDSGINTVTLHNAGVLNGFVTIWISDIVSSEGTNPESEAGDTAEPGELTNYLMFDLSCSRLSTNLSLPATIDSFPLSPPGSYYIMIPLNAGDTVNLNWEWEFPETGAPQNDAQGDSLSFTINYLLAASLSGGGAGGGGGAGDGGDGGAPSYQKLRIDILGAVTLAKVSSSGKLLDSHVATNPDNKHKLEFNQGTRVTCTSGKLPRRIEMKVREELLSIPSGMEIIGPAYDLTGYIQDLASCPVIFDKPAKLTLSYDPSWLPKNTSSILITSHDVDQGWVELEAASGSAAEPGEITALISHTSTFAIMAKLAPSPPAAPSPPPVPSPPIASPEFELSDLNINPTQTEAGRPVTIWIMLQNTGKLAGSYTVNLRINARIVQSKEITLAAGENTQVSFTVVKEQPGTYALEVNGLVGEFIVLARPSPRPLLAIYWWVVPLPVIICLMVYFTAIRPRHHP